MTDATETCEVIPEKIKPQLDQKVGSQQEKPEKCTEPRRRSRSSDAVLRGRRTERVQVREGRQERGRSADSHQSPKCPVNNLDETECPICFFNYDNAFKTPKLLSCDHTFCLECLARINMSSSEIKTLTCPVCRELTEIRHGRDLAQLGNNEDIFRKLPPSMQQAQQVKVKRSKGKLVLTNESMTSCLHKKSTIVPEGAVEREISGATVVNVGRPVRRVTRYMRRIFRSNLFFYTVVVSIVLVAMALIILSVMTSVVIPGLKLDTTGQTPQSTSNSDENQNE